MTGASASLNHDGPEDPDWAGGDEYVAFGQRNGMTVIGHALVWHNQTGTWVFQGPEGKPADRETLLARMRNHIQTVVGRYKGRIHGWDVVNEAIDEDGSLRKTPWRNGIKMLYYLRLRQMALAGTEVEICMSCTMQQLLLR